MICLTETCAIGWSYLNGVAEGEDGQAGHRLPESHRAREFCPQTGHVPLNHGSQTLKDRVERRDPPVTVDVTYK